jgi:hypothetical protein
MVENKKAKNVYIVLFHNYVTNNGQNHVVERCEFVDVLKKKALRFFHYHY